jgi:hypothetical protein
MLLDGIQMNVMDMLVIVFRVANPMIRKPAMPNLRIRSEFPPHLKRKTAFNELNSAFQRDQGSDEQMKMIRHQDKFV